MVRLTLWREELLANPERFGERSSLQCFLGEIARFKSLVSTEGVNVCVGRGNGLWMTLGAYKLVGEVVGGNEEVADVS
jgi:hypothetical protein